MEENRKSNKQGKTVFIISVVVFVLLLIACLLYLKMCTPFFMDGNTNTVSSNATDTGGQTQQLQQTDSAAESAPEIILPENPINFSAQMEQNDEIYAWIYIPNTNVNYPILQSREDDLYYLRRGLDRNYSIPGVIFTQSHNKRDFSDPVTVAYGHNMTEDGSMFATLHNFEDAAFFEANEDLFVYTPGHILKYRIISAFKYDDRHIMNTFDFDNKEDRKAFFDHVQNPSMIPQNVREGVNLGDDDRLLVLSTCMANNSYRYLVCAVFVSDEITK